MDLLFWSLRLIFVGSFFSLQQYFVLQYMHKYKYSNLKTNLWYQNICICIIAVVSNWLISNNWMPAWFGKADWNKWTTMDKLIWWGNPNFQYPAHIHCTQLQHIAINKGKFYEFFPTNCRPTQNISASSLSSQIGLILEQQARKPPGTLGLKKFGLGKLWVEKVGAQNIFIDCL